MLKGLFVGLTSALVVSFASAAGAQELGSKGDAIFGAERLFGVRGEHWNLDYPPGAPDITVDQTVIAFGWARTVVPYNEPRLAFDYLIMDKFSVGGALGYSTSSADPEGPIGVDDRSYFLIAPRAGFLHMFGSVAGIWARGGFTFHSTSFEGDASESALAVNLEAMFPIVIAPQFGVQLGLAFDQSLTGTLDPENGPEADVTYRSIGLQVGMFGWI